MPQISAYKRIQGITEFAWHCKSVDQLVAYLSANICPFGELTGVGTATLDSDGFVRVQSRFGFSDSLPVPPPVHISADNPSVKALQELRMQIFEMNQLHDRHRDIPDTVRKDSEYVISVVIPVSHTKIYGFAFQRDIRIFNEYLPYLEFISSILSHWENVNSLQMKSTLSRPMLMDEELTPRQKEIVILIRQGKTNSSIAVILGFSESLIRQETITIYRKLGVSGRRDLITEQD